MDRGTTKQFMYEEALPARSTKHTCPTCGLVCKSAGGLNRHSKIHKDAPPTVTSNNGKFKYYASRKYMQDCSWIEKTSACTWFYCDLMKR